MFLCELGHTEKKRRLNLFILSNYLYEIEIEAASTVAGGRGGVLVNLSSLVGLNQS